MAEFALSDTLNEGVIGEEAYFELFNEHCPYRCGDCEGVDDG